MQPLADVDRDQRTEAADREQPRRHREHDEQQRGVVHDEPHALRHVVQHGVHAAVRRRALGPLNGFPPGDRHGPDEGGGREEADGIERVAQVRAKRRDERPGGRRTDDADPHHGDLHQRVRREQTLRRHVTPDRDRLRRSEKARHDAERDQDRVDLPQRRREQQQHHEPRADQIARHERGFELPSIDEHAGQRSEDREREHVRDLDAGHLRRRPVQVERHDADHREEREEVAEKADDLRVPHAAHDVELQDVAERHRDRRR